MSPLPVKLMAKQHCMCCIDVNCASESDGQIMCVGKSVIGSNILIEVNERFTHFGSCFWNCHDVSAPQLEVLVT